MKRIVKNNIDQQLINSMVLYHLECLKHNYKELLKYIKNKNYSPSLKVIFLYDYEYCVPTVVNMSLGEFLGSDLYIGKDEIEIKKI